MGPLLLTWISNYRVWDEIISPFPNFNGAAVEVWKWISNSIPHFTGHDYLSLLWLKLIHVHKRGPWGPFLFWGRLPCVCEWNAQGWVTPPDDHLIWCISNCWFFLGTIRTAQGISMPRNCTWHLSVADTTCEYTMLTWKHFPHHSPFVTESSNDWWISLKNG